MRRLQETGVRSILQGNSYEFLDSDDVLDPGKISIQVNSLRANAGADFAYGRILDLETRTRVLYGHSEMSAERMILKQFVSPTFTTLGPLCRRGMVERLGPWDENLSMCQDWEYHSRAAVLGFRGVFTPEAIAYVRQTGDDRVSWNFGEQRASVWCRARTRHLSSMWYYAPQELKEDQTFRSGIAWNHAVVTARAIRLGCSVDDHASYSEAKDTAVRGVVHILMGTLILMRRFSGPKIVSTTLLALSWCSHKARASRNRFLRIRKVW